MIIRACKMKKFFVDTNVWLRYLLADKKKEFIDCQKFFISNEKGEFRLYTSTIVLLEIIYTLNSFYKIPRPKIISDIETILETRNLTLLEKTNFSEALSLFKRLSIKLADCLIASQLPKGVILCTYDNDFKKIKNLETQTPAEII